MKIPIFAFRSRVPSRGRSRSGPRPVGHMPALALLLRLMFFVALGRSLASPTAPAAEPSTALRPITLHIAFTPCAFLNLNRQDAEAAFRVLVEVVGRRSRFEVTATTRVYDEDADLRKAILADEVDLALIDARTFLALEVAEAMVPHFVASESGRAGKRYVLVARRETKFTRIEDLRGLEILENRVSNGTVGEFWLETLLRCRGLGSPAAFFGSIQTVGKPSAAVLPVFFGNRGATLIDESGYNLMVELNPQIGTTLQPLATSEPLVDGLVCLRSSPWKSADEKRDIVRALAELHTDPAGLQTLTLFRMDRLEPFQPSHLDTIRRLFDRGTSGCVEVSATSKVPSASLTGPASGGSSR